jgi:hypothetical protein
MDNDNIIYLMFLMIMGALLFVGFMEMISDITPR